MMELDFYFDVGSPTAYLAHKRLQQLSAQYALQVNAKPMLLGGVFKATSNQSPVTIHAKAKYMLEEDLPRFAKRYSAPLNFNLHFPVNTLMLMRGVYAARKLNCEPAYIDAVFDGMWVKGLAMGEVEVVAQLLTDEGMDAGAILELAGDPEIKQALIDTTDEAISRGAFGAPTMFVGDTMLFGQDRLDFVEEWLRDEG
ncbi:MAG: 2-hydroxychromene-2-carboxylate isomerase [Congregibacter sp.]